MTSEKKETRRRYSAAVKAQVVAECDEPVASVAKVAMSHGINANVVHRWRQLAREGESPVLAKTCEFMPERDRGRPFQTGPLPHHPACGSAPGGSKS